MISVFEYSDYRTFLKDRFHAEKLRRKHWSYGVWAKEVGVSSPSTLIMLLNGSRHPGPRLTEILVRNLRLDPPEAAYFFDLVHLAKAKGNSRLQVLLMEKLKRQHPKGEFRVLDHDTFSAISNWHYYAIRELVRVHSFQEDPEWICRKLRFKVTPKQATQAIATLIRLNLLRRGPDGKLVQSSGHIDTRTDVADEGLKRFHEQMLQLAKESIRLTDPSRRQISGTTFPIQLKKLTKAKELIRKFQAELCELCEESAADAVFQLEISFFPLTKLEKENQ